MFALIAAHLSHLCLNWNDDTYVFRQRVNWDGRRTNENQQHKPPQALPADCARNIRYVRLIITLILLVVEVYGGYNCTNYNLDGTCKDNISHVSHACGALSGFIMGIAVLRARRLRKAERKLKIFLLTIVYGPALGYVIHKLVTAIKQNNKPPLNSCQLIEWTSYEKICQDVCYRREERNVSYSCDDGFTVYKSCCKSCINLES